MDAISNLFHAPLIPIFQKPLRMSRGEEKKKRWQFSIRQLLAITTLVALTFVMPPVLLVNVVKIIGAVLLAGCFTFVIDKLVVTLFFREHNKE